MTQPAHWIPTMMERTLDNLKFVRNERERLKSEGVDVDVAGPFEVTQLVNSILCAFAHPWELLLKPERDKRKAARDPMLKESVQRLSRHLHLSANRKPTVEELITGLGYIRNAIAHGNIEYIPGPTTCQGTQDIEKIRLWNCRFEEKTKNWEQAFTIDELSALLDDFVSVANELWNPSKLQGRKDCENDPD